MRLFRTVLLLLLLAPAFGCGKPDYKHGRPEILELSSPTQIDAFKLRFSITFSDTDQDLGLGGSVHVLVDGVDKASQKLSDIFPAQTPPIAPNAPAGTFDVIVALSPNIEVGQNVTIGFFLLDARGLKSNVPDVVLQAT